MKKLSILFSLAVAMLFSSCAKDGDPGATGPQGPAGANGNANVKYWDFNISPGQWISAGTAGSGNCQKYFDYSIPDLTADFVEKGAVLVYWNSNGTYVQFPLTSMASPNNFITFTSFAEVGTVDITIQLSNLQFPTTTGLSMDVHVVGIDGHVLRTHPEINWKDPIQVQRFLNMAL